MTAVGIVVGLSTWRATVHYVDCHYYRGRAPRQVPLPRTIKMKLCAYCRPTEDDVRAAPPEVSWYAYSPLPGPQPERVPFEHAEQLVARGPHYGRRPRRSTGWAS